MHLKKFIMEVGMGLDQHGQSPTNAARKAVKDAISRSCLTGLLEIARLEDVNEMIVEVLVACPTRSRSTGPRSWRPSPLAKSRSKWLKGE